MFLTLSHLSVCCSLSLCPLLPLSVCCVLSLFVAPPLSLSVCCSLSLSVAPSLSLYCSLSLCICCSTWLLLHLIAAPPGCCCAGSFCVGDAVTVEVDGNRRMLHARLHSAGHLLDAAFSNIGFTELEPSKVLTIALHLLLFHF